MTAKELLNPQTLYGAASLGLMFLALAFAAVASALAQVLTLLTAFVLYEHLIPELRALGTALLAGVSVVSVVIGLAAQSTLGNLVAGFSLVLYRQLHVGDVVRLATPAGVSVATVEVISLGFTTLRDEEAHEVIVPNSVMMSSTVIRISRASHHG